jgi:hypothetical protein
MIFIAAIFGAGLVDSRQAVIVVVEGYWNFRDV